MSQQKTTITVKQPNAGPLYLVDVVMTDWITDEGERYRVAYDDEKNRYESTDETYNDFGQPETIWIKRSGK
jgi:hypothetical protein